MLRLKVPAVGQALSRRDTDPLSMLEALRNETRSWLKANIPEGWRAAMSDPSPEQFIAFQQEWFRKLAKAGLAAPHWPREWGGGGRSLAEQVVIYEEIARAGAPRLMLHFVSLYHAGLTLLEWGTDEQKRRHLPQILQGEVWCQGFSEPNAGSDLAALKTRAERKGDRYVVNGQKIWSTLGHFAQRCLLLARTDPTAAKHHGITYFLLDLDAKGIDRRPIRQITGDQEFCEIFLDDVEIPAENVVGGENQGWQVAQTTLSAERGLAILELSERMRLGFHSFLIEDREHGNGEITAFRDDEFRREIADLYSKIEALRALVGEFMESQMAGHDVSGQASIVKLYYAHVARQFTDLGLRLQGAAGSIHSPILLGAGYETGNWMLDYLNSYQYNIAGGSNEIQRNIISERVLGLPREPRL